MKDSAIDRIAGKVNEIQGGIKQAAGQLVNDPDLEAEGQADKLAGKMRKKVGQVEKVFEK